MTWTRKKLCDICDVRDGTHDSPKYISDGFPLVTSKNIKDGKIDFSEVNFISQKDYDEINKRSRVDRGDILMPMIGTIGNPAVVDVSSNFAIKNVCLIKKNDYVNMKYLLYVLKSDIFGRELLNRSRGGTQKFIALGDIRNFELPLPPLHIQQQIADTLDKADALRQKDQQLLQKYDELAQSIFYEMFGEVSLTASGADVLKILGGAAFKSTDFTNNGLPLIRIGTINKGYFDNQQLVFLPEKFVSQYRRYLVYPGDLLMTLTGTVGKDDYGNVFVLQQEYERYFLNQRVAKIEFDKDLLTAEYLRYYFKQKEVKEQLTGISRGVRQANISNSDIYSLLIPLPSMNDQIRFSTALEIVGRLRNAVVESDIESLFGNLLNQNFS